MAEECARRGDFVQVNLWQGQVQEPVLLEARIYITLRNSLIKGDSQMLCFPLLVNVFRQRNLPPHKVFLLTSMIVAKPVLVNAAMHVVECNAAGSTRNSLQLKEAVK